MAKSLITQTFGVPSQGEISDKVARLSEAGCAFETKRRELEHQFEVKASELREEDLTALLEIHASEANGSQRWSGLGRVAGGWRGRRGEGRIRKSP